MNMDMVPLEDLKLIGFHFICAINPDTGYGSCLLNRDYNLPAMDPLYFPYEEAMTYLIEHNITEEDVADTVAKMSLSAVTEALSEDDIYHVYYSCEVNNQTIAYRKASFTKGPEGQVILYLQDITDEMRGIRRSNLELIEQRKEAIQQSNITDRILRLLERDFRTHLFSLTGLTDLMMTENILMAADKYDEAEYTFYEDIDTYLEQIFLSESQMGEILNDVRELQEMITWDEYLQEDRISIEEMLRYYDKPFSEHCEYMSTFYSWDTSETEHPEFISDETVLARLLMRLLRYLISNSSPGGYIRLDVSEEAEADDISVYTFSLLADQCNLTIEQLAEGTMNNAGIFRELQKDLNAIDFNLVLMKQYVEMLKGSCSVRETEEGKQINLAFRFRRADSGAGAGSFPNAAADTPRSVFEVPIVEDPGEIDLPDFSGKTALVIDDNIINLEVTSRLLRKCGFLVADADDGEKGLNAFIRDQGRFDVIILDIRMPGISGPEVARRIRTLGQQGASIPIIALTANDRPEEKQLSFDAGMNDYLIKPANPKVLYRILEKYVKQQDGD